jgi:hypothetical protein
MQMNAGTVTITAGAGVTLKAMAQNLKQTRNTR